jgi:redox-sensitive bicupin YhaK (pirin superfamily)
MESPATLERDADSTYTCTCAARKRGASVTRIAPQSGFTWHPHRGLEIYTWVLEGTLHHEDSTGGQGDIGSGEFQRMFSGDWIEHQELNLTDEPVRVIQIWFAADPRFRGLPPHYQQPSRAAFPMQPVDGATVRNLMGDGSPMEQHTPGRLTATSVEPGGAIRVEVPRPGEDLFLYVTDGAAQAHFDGQTIEIGQYDVLLARPDAEGVSVDGVIERPLHFLSFFLPGFLP